MRDSPNEKRSSFYFLEVAVIATVALLVTVSFAPHQGGPTFVRSPTVLDETAPPALEPALQSLDGVTQHG